MAFLDPTVIAKDGLLVLENNTVLAGLVHRGYEKEFQSVGATVLIRKPSVWSAASVSDTVNEVSVSESSVSVILNQHLDVTVPITSKELSLSVVDFSTQITQPALVAIGQKVDELIAALYVDIGGHYVVAATPAVSDIAGVKAVLSTQKSPVAERKLVFHPVTEADYVSLDAFLHASKRGDGGAALKSAELGHVMGFDCYMDQNMPTHTAGVAADGVGALKGTLKAGDGTATIDAVTSGATVLAGDVFKITGVDEWHVVTTTATASVATLTVLFTPVIKATSVVDNATVTFQTASHRNNLAFHKNCFAFVTAPLAPPIGGARAGAANHKGVAIRVVYDYNIMSKKNYISFDILSGYKTLDQYLGCRLIDTR